MSAVPEDCEEYEGMWIRKERGTSRGREVGGGGLIVPRIEYVVIDPANGYEIERFTQRIEAMNFIHNYRAQQS